MKGKKVSIAAVLKTLIWPRRKRLLIGLVLITLGKLAGLVIPGSFKYLIDDVLISQDRNLLNLVLLSIILAVFIQAITSFLLAKIVSVAAHRVIAELRIKIQEKVIHLPISFFDKNKSGAIAKRVMDDIDGVKNLIGTGFVMLIGGSISSIGALIILLYINTKLTLYVIIPLVIMGVISLKAYQYLRPIFRTRKTIEANVQGRLVESLGGIRVVKGFSAENHEKEVFSKGVQKIFNYYNKTITAQALFISLATLILGLASAMIIWLGSNLILKGELEIGEFVSFILYLGFMISPIIQISNIGSLLTEAMAGLDRTEKILNLVDERENKERDTPFIQFNEHLIFDHVSFAYEANNYVIKDLSCTLPKGSTTALVGLSGAGKSTIAGLVASFIEPTEGTILIDNQNLSKIQLDTYRSFLGVVLQDDFLFDGTIKDNILFAKKNATQEALEQAIKLSNVHEFTDRFKDGIETIIGERGVKLSGGQKQRISIARALLSNPKILILDEATSSLDAKSELLIQKSLANLTKGRTTLIIAHRLSTIQNADQILVIDQGKVVEKGKHDELMRLKGNYYQLIQLQSKV